MHETAPAVSALSAQLWRIVTGQTKRVLVDVTLLGEVYLVADVEVRDRLETAFGADVLEACAQVAMYGTSGQQGSGRPLRTPNV